MIRLFFGLPKKSCRFVRVFMVWHEHLDETRKFQRGLGGQKLFISVVGAVRLIQAA